MYPQLFDTTHFEDSVSCDEGQSQGSEMLCPRTDLLIWVMDHELCLVIFSEDSLVVVHQPSAITDASRGKQWEPCTAFLGAWAARMRVGHG